MARPKSEDPTVAVMFRMKKSAADFWNKEADKSGRKLNKHLQWVLEERSGRA